MNASEATPRARAAWAYSLKEQRDLAMEAGLSYGRLRAILGVANRTDVQLEELHRIADAAGVPRDFMECGYDDAGLAERLSQIEKDFETQKAAAAENAAEVARQFDDMRQTMSRLQSRLPQ